MPDYQFLQNPISKKWVILAPRRAKRPDVAKGFEPVCPFCLGREKDEAEAYRIGGSYPDSNWQIRVIPNKFPFAQIHEVIIHSPDHHKNFEQLSIEQGALVFRTYRERYNAHKDKGYVCIFHNRGEKGGESLPHPHSQLALIPFEVKTDIPRLDPAASIDTAPAPHEINKDHYQTVVAATTVVTSHFYLFCPHTSQWPDEVWIAPKKRGRAFGEATDEELSDLAVTLSRVIQILDMRHGDEFSYNFYIYPAGDWYLRLIPRVKTIGGFELCTGIFVNTQDPGETISFIKEHFENPDFEKIKAEHQAQYHRWV